MSDHATIGEIVQAALETLTPSERRVARALLETYPAAGLESLPRLAAAAGVTPPTVLRFVRKLGFGGYRHFQDSLRTEVQARMESPLTLYRRPAPYADASLLDATLGVLHEGLEKTFRSVTDATFTAVVELLADQRRDVVFTGGRFSQLVAHFLQAQMRMLRPGCILVGDTFSPRKDTLLDVGTRTVVCVFDYRRYQEDTVAFAREAAARGATVVLFTDPWLSPATDVARHVLMSHPDSPSPFDSMIGAFGLAEAVLAGVVAKLGVQGKERVAELERVRGEVRGIEEAREAREGDTA